MDLLVTAILVDFSSVAHNHVAVTNRMHLVDPFRVNQLVKLAEQLGEQLYDLLRALDVFAEGSEADHVCVEKRYVVDLLDDALVVF